MKKLYEDGKAAMRGRMTMSQIRTMLSDVWLLLLSNGWAIAFVKGGLFRNKYS